MGKGKLKPCKSDTNIRRWMIKPRFGSQEPVAMDDETNTRPESQEQVTQTMLTGKWQ